MKVKQVLKIVMIALFKHNKYQWLWWLLFVSVASVSDCNDCPTQVQQALMIAMIVFDKSASTQRLQSLYFQVLKLQRFLTLAKQVFENYWQVHYTCHSLVCHSFFHTKSRFFSRNSWSFKESLRVSREKSRGCMEKRRAYFFRAITLSFH